MGKLSYVVPVYHNQGSITPTRNSIAALFESALSSHTYEIIFVDDGSQDGSWDEMEDVASMDPRVKLVRFTRNFGQLAALIAGYRAATGDVVISMSADLQDPVELTIDMVAAWERGSEVVIGYRRDRDDPLAARVFSRIAYGTLRLSNKEIPAGGFDFVLMSRRALSAFLSYPGRNRFYQGDVLWAGFTTTYLPYFRRKREIGRSQYTFSKKLKLFFDFVLDGSYVPIRAMSLSGVATATLGLLYAAVISIGWALGLTPFAGWAPIMVALLVLGGGIMLMLGIIGEYLWRILDEIKGKPLYVVAPSTRETGAQPPASADQ